MLNIRLWRFLFINCLLIISFSRVKGQIFHGKLNLGFEKLDSNKLPVKVIWQSHGGRYNVSIDSTDKVEGKYSLLLQSVKTPDSSGISFIDIMFQVRGNCLKNKHIEVTGYLKLENINTIGSQASLWYYKNPSISHLVFNGLMNLHGTSDWKKYKLEFDTDSSTTWVTFGAILWGTGKVNVDNLAVFANSTKIEYSDCNPNP